MTATVDNAVADLQHASAELQRRLDEALGRERAMAEVLAVINSSPGDLMPVFQTIVEKAHLICDAAYGSLQLWDGERFSGVAIGISGVPRAGAHARGAMFEARPIVVPGQRIVMPADRAGISETPIEKALLVKRWQSRQWHV